MNLFNTRIALTENLISFALDNNCYAGLLIDIRDRLEVNRGRWNRMVRDLPYETTTL